MGLGDFFSSSGGGSIIGGLIGGAASLIGGMQSVGVATMNNKFAREQYEYQKWAQQQTWNREDNATQRRVTDLKAAGLSPVLAAGSAASSSSPIKIEAPTQDPRYTKGAAIADAIQQGLSLALQQRQLQQADATIAKTKSEQLSIDAQTQRAIVGTETDRLNQGLFPLREKLMQVEFDLGRGNISRQQAEIELKHLMRDIQTYDFNRSMRSNVRYKDAITPMTYLDSAVDSTGQMLDSLVGKIDSYLGSSKNGGSGW